MSGFGFGGGRTMGARVSRAPKKRDRVFGAGSGSGNSMNSGGKGGGKGGGSGGGSGGPSRSRTKVGDKRRKK